MKNLKYKKSFFLQIFKDSYKLLIGTAVSFVLVVTGLFCKYYLSLDGEETIRQLANGQFSLIVLILGFALITGALAWTVILMLTYALYAVFSGIYAFIKGYLEKVDIIRRLPTDVNELKDIGIKSYNDFALFAFSFFLVKTSITSEIFGKSKFVAFLSEKNAGKGVDCRIVFDKKTEDVFYQLGKYFDSEAHDEMFIKIKNAYRKLLCYEEYSEISVAHVFLNAEVFFGTLNNDCTEWTITNGLSALNEAQCKVHPVKNVYNLFFGASSEIKQVCTEILRKKGFNLCFEEEEKIILKIRRKRV